MSNRVKIFLVAHKPFEIPEGEALVPIHVGRMSYVRRMMDDGRRKKEDGRWMMEDGRGHRFLIK